MRGTPIGCRQGLGDAEDHEATPEVDSHYIAFGSIRLTWRGPGSGRRNHSAEEKVTHGQRLLLEFRMASAPSWGHMTRNQVTYAS
jgi:hypothetical protein